MKIVLKMVMSFSILASSASFGGNISDAMDPSKVGLAAKFVRIKAGTFTMGSPENEEGRYDYETQHQVTLTKDFEMQATEVTQLQFFLVTGGNPSYVNNQDYVSDQYYCPESYQNLGGVSLCPNHPVEEISWNRVEAFIGELNRVSSQYFYRLPTEAEYEYATRGGTTTAYFFGDDSTSLDDYAWQGTNAHEVGQKKANPNGLYDIIGNVWEWVSDWYGPYSTTPQNDPVGPDSGSSRVLRGGNFVNYPWSLRSAQRSYSSPGDRYINVGFRLVRTPK